MSPPASSPPSSGPNPVARLRLQAAVVRSLLDELDDRAPAGAAPEHGLVEQLADELQRLGREVRRLAGALAEQRPGVARCEDTLEGEPSPRRMTLVAL